MDNTMVCINMKLQLAILREAKPIILRIADREAPDQKPKISHNKKKKNKKRRRKRKNVEKLNQDVSFESVEADKKDKGKDSLFACSDPIELVPCSSDNCEKMFASESALQYHVSFAHQQIIKKQDAASKDERTFLQEPQMKTNDVYLKKDLDLNKQLSAQEHAGTGDIDILHETVKIAEGDITKPLPYTHNIHQTFPVQSPHIAGSLPKPVLPAPVVNLCLDKFSNKSPSCKLERSTISTVTKIILDGKTLFLKLLWKECK